jgi:Trk K+ transport system NAD-binding subunit
MEEKEEAPEEVAPAAAEQPVPEDDAIRNAVAVIAENYASKVRLYNMLKTPNLVFTEADGNKQVTMMVVSVAQKKYIEEQLLRELEGGLRKTLSTSRLVLLVDVMPDSEVDKQKKPYMPGEQARDLIAKNENVRSLVEQFKLDTK